MNITNPLLIEIEGDFFDPFDIVAITLNKDGVVNYEMVVHLRNCSNTFNYASEDNEMTTEMFDSICRRWRMVRSACFLPAGA